MFETAKPVPMMHDARFPGANLREGDLRVGHHDAAPRVPAPGAGQASGGGALRMIEWSELTARLNAARDLRLVLRRDQHIAIGQASGSFADAAARYFQSCEEREPDVNPVALEHPKCSPGIDPDHEGSHDHDAHQRANAEAGDARED